MKNKLVDLNNHLFEQMERLNDETLEGAKLSAEIDRSKAMAGVAKEIINTQALALDAQKALGENLINKAPEMMGVEKPKLVGVSGSKQ
ncbi:MAG: hypothetical protein OEX07_03315 [Gammaproteobacteria bacterium]|nr:hypothetical protein [Gammaproteobacteria bacterium]